MMSNLASRYNKIPVTELIEQLRERDFDEGNFLYWAVYRCSDRMSFAWDQKYGFLWTPINLPQLEELLDWLLNDVVDLRGEIA